MEIVLILRLAAWYRAVAPVFLREEWPVRWKAAESPSSRPIATPSAVLVPMGLGRRWAFRERRLRPTVHGEITIAPGARALTASIIGRGRFAPFLSVPLLVLLFDGLLASRGSPTIERVLAVGLVAAVAGGIVLASIRAARATIHALADEGLRAVGLIPLEGESDPDASGSPPA